jgi:hypothetical protein
MTQNQIIKEARKLNASAFLELLERKKVFTEILDQDNIFDANDGYLNVIVEGMPDGESILFFDGELSE